MRHLFLTISVLLGVLGPALAKTYPVDGIVIGVVPSESQVVVSHRPIAGYMAAMTMRFQVQDAEELSGIEPGMRVQFDLVVNGTSTVARRIRRIQQNEADIQLPADRLRTGDPLPDFTLTDQNGRQQRLTDFRGRVIVVDFIYTRCPVAEMCPRLSANFAAVQARFTSGPGEAPLLLSITIDPLHDTPAVLNEYAKRWKADSHRWLFLTGTMPQIRLVAQRFGLIYWPEDDAITHNATTTVFNREGKVAAIVDGSSYRFGQLCDLISSQLRGTR